MNVTDTTIDFYNNHASSFLQDTVNAKMTGPQMQFLKYLPAEGMILDLGCGSGRDSKVFLDAGYHVVMIDGSKELCKKAEGLTGQHVICSSFQDYIPADKFDGIWACASLLHLEHSDIAAVTKKLSSALKQGGYFYMSFKYGNFSGDRNGRYYSDMDESSLERIMKGIPELSLISQYITGDVRETRQNEKWLNAVYCKR